MDYYLLRTVPDPLTLTLFTVCSGGLGSTALFPVVFFGSFFVCSPACLTRSRWPWRRVHAQTCAMCTNRRTPTGVTNSDAPVASGGSPFALPWWASVVGLNSLAECMRFWTRHARWGTSAVQSRSRCWALTTSRWTTVSPGAILARASHPPRSRARSLPLRLF